MRLQHNILKKMMGSEYFLNAIQGCNELLHRHAQAPEV